MKSVYNIFCLLLAVFMLQGCSSSPEYFVKSFANEYYGIPFNKKHISQIKITYWVRVRESRYYNGRFDSGVRKRTLFVSNEELVKKALRTLKVRDRMWYTLGIPANIEFIASSEDKWNATLRSNNKLLMSPSRILILTDSGFHDYCHALCVRKEKTIHPEADFGTVSLYRNIMEYIPSLNYDVRYDGISEASEYVFYEN